MTARTRRQPTPAGFCRLLEAAGLDAELAIWGGPGSPAIPTVYLPDGRTGLLSDEDGCLGGTDAPEVYELPMPARLHLGVYESQAENEARGADAGSPEPLGFLSSCTPLEAEAALGRAARGDYSAFTPDPGPCPALRPVEWLLTTAGRPMFNRATRRYLRHVAIVAPERWATWQTVTCPECGRVPAAEPGATPVPSANGVYVISPEGTHGHVLMGRWVVLGCEGYFTVNPAQAGLDPGGWQDWRLS